MIKEQKTTRELPVALTPSEIGQAQKRIADIVGLKLSKERELASLRKSVAALTAEQETLSAQLSSGFEYRAIECRTLLDYSRAHVFIERCDTGEQIDSRQMTAAERQLELGDILAAPAPDSTPESKPKSERKRGWPKGRPRGPRKAKEVIDANDALDIPPWELPQATVEEHSEAHA